MRGIRTRAAYADLVAYASHSHSYVQGRLPDGAGRGCSRQRRPRNPTMDGCRRPTGTTGWIRCGTTRGSESGTPEASGSSRLVQSDVLQDMGRKDALRTVPGRNAYRPKPATATRYSLPVIRASGPCDRLRHRKRCRPGTTKDGALCGQCGTVVLLCEGGPIDGLGEGRPCRGMQSAMPETRVLVQDDFAQEHGPYGGTALLLRPGRNAPGRRGRCRAPPPSYGRNAHYCAPPAQIRTWTLIHPAPTSGA